jgi:hypothetical protein
LYLKCHRYCTLITCLRYRCGITKVPVTFSPIIKIRVRFPYVSGNFFTITPIGISNFMSHKTSNQVLYQSRNSISLLLLLIFTMRNRIFSNSNVKVHTTGSRCFKAIGLSFKLSNSHIAIEFPNISNSFQKVFDLALHISCLE